MPDEKCGFSRYAPQAFHPKTKVRKGNDIIITNDDVKRPPENHTPRQHNGQNGMKHKKSKTGDSRNPVMARQIFLVDYFVSMKASLAGKAKKI